MALSDAEDALLHFARCGTCQGSAALHTDDGLPATGCGLDQTCAYAAVVDAIATGRVAAVLGVLTDDERESLRGLGQGQVAAAVEQILTGRRAALDRH